MKLFTNPFAVVLGVTAGVVIAAPSFAQTVVPPTQVAGRAGNSAASTLLAGVVGGAQAQTPAKSPVAEWNFSEGAGTTTTDVSGHNNSGTLFGGATWTTGVVGSYALHVTGYGDGSGSGLDIPKPIVDTSRSFSVSAWVKVNKLNPGGFQTFVGIDGNQVSGFFLQSRYDGHFGLTVPPTDDSSINMPAVASSLAPFNAGVWYHLVGVHDQLSQTLALYVNGVPQGTVPFTTPWKAGGHTVLGRGRFGSKAVDFAEADIDDVRFYDTALTATDVVTITRQGLPAATLHVDASVAAGKVSPTLYGIMTEEINHSNDGGVYAELISNRAFKDDPSNPRHWTLLHDADAAGSMFLDTSQPINDALSTSLRVTVNSTGAGGRIAIANDGYWGIPVKPDTRYKASFWAKAGPNFKGGLKVEIESGDGRVVYASAGVGKLKGSWKRYDVTLKTDAKAAATSNARFVLGTDSTGTFNVTLVSLFPPTYGDRDNGNRPDIMQKLADMKPTFLRFPGGAYLVGNSTVNRFDWKKTVGPIEARSGHPGTWGYRSSDGLGLLEYAEWCEDLHMEPLLAVYAGYSTKDDHVSAGPSLVPFVQDALDEIEYLTGDKSTRWGGQRVKDGHSAPFTLHYLEIGNEDGYDPSNSYEGRFTQFYDAIKAHYPQLLLVATTQVKSRTPDVVDEHYYRTAADMESHANQYDSYSRSGPKVVVGEWASEVFDRPWEHPVNGQPPTPNWQESLGDAAWLTGLERNSDIVVLESYAPLLVNVNDGARQWTQNLIGYDAQSCFGSPSYWVQQVFGTHVGDSILHTTVTGAINLYSSVTQDTTSGTVYLKMVNTSDQVQPVKIDLRGAASIRTGQDGTAITLASARLTDTNSIDEPENILPVTTKFPFGHPIFTYSFPPYSVTVLVLGGK